MIDQKAIVYAHGVLACLAWVIFFPLGSVLVRVVNRSSIWKAHAAIQVFAMAMFTAAVGTGIQMAKKFRLLDNFHIIIGLLIFALMFIQAFGGWLHHIIFKKTQRRGIVTHVHLWLGRILITGGMVNGGLGLWINRRSKKSQIIAYGVVAGVIWVSYLVTSAIYEARKSDKVTSAAMEARRSAREKRVQERAAKRNPAHKQTMPAEGKEWA